MPEARFAGFAKEAIEYSSHPTNPGPIESADYAKLLAANVNNGPNEAVAAIASGNHG